MRAALRLAITSWSGRPSRSALLTAAVALSAALITCVACAMATVNAALRAELESTVGAADLRLEAPGTGGRVPIDLADAVRAWEGVQSASPWLEAALSLSFVRPTLQRPPVGDWALVEQSFRATALATSVPAPGSGSAGASRSPRLLAGRLPAAGGEIVIDALLADLLGWRDAADQGPVSPLLRPRVGDAASHRADSPRPDVPPPNPTDEQARAFNESQRVRLGDRIAAQRQVLPAVDLPFLAHAFAGNAVELTVVGIAAQPPLGGRPLCYLTLDGLAALIGAAGEASAIDIAVAPGVEPQAVIDAHADSLPAGLLLQTTEKITSGIDKNMASSELGLVLATVMAFLAAGFIILTGITTNVTEQQRELAVLRCIGATGGQLARGQLVYGLLVGGLGGLLGVPLGVALAAGVALAFREQLPDGLTVQPRGLALALVGSVVCGVGAAAWPAWRVARTSPLRALASRAESPRPRGLVATTVAAGAALAFQVAVVRIPDDGQVIFWLYATLGLPVMFVGYFLLGVPLTLLVTRAAAPGVSRALRLPPRMLARTIQATPYRHGFTAGALMSGLAMLVALWTNGGAVLRDWLDKVQFPDAFVTGIALSPESQRRLDAMSDIVETTCAISLLPVDTDAFGVRALQSYKTNFIAFEPEPFFRMTRLTWVQGDEREARRRLDQGGAVLVAREFLAARGLGVGHRFQCEFDGQRHEFEIVGVVTSPGLELVSRFFNIGQDFSDQAIHAVFGTRRDLRERFHTDTIQLIQIGLRPGVDDAAAVARFRDALWDAGILDAGSGRQIKTEINRFASDALLVISAIAVLSMAIACLGVANLIIAGIEARRFEFGVLRAVGGSRGLLARLVLGEAGVIALAACVLGTALGIQGSWAGQRLDELLMGIELELRPPLRPIAAGWLAVLAWSLIAAGPAVARLLRVRPRDLLAAMKG